MGFFSSLASGVEKWGESIEDDFKWGVKQGENVVTHTEDTFSDIISIPLILLAGGVALFLYNSNAGQVAEGAKNVAPLFV